MNFYEGRHEPTGTDRLKELEDKKARFDALPLEQREKMIRAEQDRRERNGGATDIFIDCTPEEAEKLKFFLYDHKDFVRHDSQAKRLYWRGCDHTIAMKVTDLIPEFAKRMASVRTQVKAHIKRKAKEAESRIKDELDNQAYRKKTFEYLEKELREARQDQTLQAELKRKLARVFTEQEKSKLIDVQTYSEEDLNRSRNNLIKSKTDLLSKIKQCEKAISKLEAEKKPFDDKAAELKEKLDND